MSTNETDTALRLLDLVLAEDPPGAVARELRQLASEASEAPALVMERLTELAEATARSFATDLATTPLYRAVALSTFQRFCVSDEWREPFIAHEDFRRHVAAHDDPDQFLRSILTTGVVFPASHSWLVASGRIEELRGDELVAGLQLDKQAAPFVLCRLSIARMAQHGVRVRRPTGYDAAVGRHTIWSADGIPVGDEFVDLDIPGNAVEVTLWRP